MRRSEHRRSWRLWRALQQEELGLITYAWLLRTWRTQRRTWRRN